MPYAKCQRCNSPRPARRPNYICSNDRKIIEFVCLLCYGRFRAENPDNITLKQQQDKLDLVPSVPTRGNATLVYYINRADLVKGVKDE